MNLSAGFATSRFHFYNKKSLKCRKQSADKGFVRRATVGANDKLTSIRSENMKLHLQILAASAALISACGADDKKETAEETGATSEIANDETLAGETISAQIDEG